MKIKTSELIGSQLDWAVYICWWCQDVAKYGDDYLKYSGCIGDGDSLWSPSTLWIDGGPIVEREGIGFWVFAEDGGADGGRYWVASGLAGGGDTPLIAAMRCYVASKLGDEVDVPEELA